MAENDLKILYTPAIGKRVVKLDPQMRFYTSSFQISYFGMRFIGSKVEYFGKVYITAPKNPDYPCLILMNYEEFLLTAKKNEKEKTKPADFNIPLEKIKSEFDEYLEIEAVEIKSKRIQIPKKKKNLLQLPDDDRRVVIIGLKEFFKLYRYCDYVKYFSEDDTDDIDESDLE